MHGPPGGPDPLAVARMRYARGEIGRDEYVQLAQDLGEAPAAERAGGARYFPLVVVFALPNRSVVLTIAFDGTSAVWIVGASFCTSV